LLQANKTANLFAKSIDDAKRKLFEQALQSHKQSYQTSLASFDQLLGDDELTDDIAKLSDKTFVLTEQLLRSVEAEENSQSLYAKLIVEREEFTNQYFVELGDISEFLEGDKTKFGARLASANFSRKADALFELVSEALLEEDPEAVLSYQSAILDAYQQWQAGWPVISEAVGALRMAMDEVIEQADGLFVSDQSIIVRRAQLLVDENIHRELLSSLNQVFSDAQEKINQVILVSETIAKNSEDNTEVALASSQRVITILGVV
jgi:hypothetical protein